MNATIEEANGKVEMMDVKINKQISLTEKFQKDVEANKIFFSLHRYQFGLTSDSYGSPKQTRMK